MANPGITWTSGYPVPHRDANEMIDRIDQIYALGNSTTVASKIVGETGGPDIDIGITPWPSDHHAVVSTFKAVPHLMRLDQIEAGKAADLRTLAGRGGELEKMPFKASVEDFYLTNPIARASAVMAECSRLASGHMLTAAE